MVQNFIRSQTHMSIKWDQRFLELAQLISTWSKDPSSKVGAVAVNDRHQVLAMGYNGFPRGIADDNRLNIREQKYEIIVHAEMNLVYNASYNGVSLDGSTVYVTGLPVCSNCAKGLIQVGVKRIVMPYNEDLPEKWKQSFELSKSMFEETNVQYEFLKLV